MELNTVVGYDFSPMADGALAYAAELVRMSGGTLHVHHVMRLPVPVNEAAMAIPYPTTEETNELRDELQKVLARNRIDGTASVSVAFAIGEGLVSYAREVGATLLVVGTHGRGGFKRAVLGSVADYVVRHADCPVTTIRQDTAFSAPRASAEIPPRNPT